MVFDLAFPLLQNIFLNILATENWKRTVSSNIYAVKIGREEEAVSAIWLSVPNIYCIILVLLLISVS